MRFKGPGANGALIGAVLLLWTVTPLRAQPADSASAGDTNTSPDPTPQDRTGAGVAPKPEPDQTLEPPQATPTPEASKPTVTPEPPFDVRAELSKMQASLAELQMRLDASEAAQANAEMAALIAESEAELEPERLRIYGFADFGVQRMWTKPSTPITATIESNATSFVIGNLNLYFDARPAPDLRTLLEIRFTNAPRGQMESVGGLGGTFSRKSTFIVDPHGPGLNVPMWWGTIVIERAWTEWKPSDAFALRVGNFFTPWGIWNVDHGSPTLISVILPQVIYLRYFPIRQTGLQALGSLPLGDWSLGYFLTLTNGRQELTNFDFDDGKALGGRLTLTHRGKGTYLRFGASAHYGKVMDEAVNLTDLGPPFVLEEITTSRYRELVLGADLSLDVDDFRLRAELVVSDRRYSERFRGASENPLFAPLGSLSPDDRGWTSYLIMAQRLPWWGLEPYLFTELRFQRTAVGDLGLAGGPGLNIHLYPGCLIKAQYEYGALTTFDQDTGTVDLAGLDAHVAIARFVTSF